MTAPNDTTDPGSAHPPADTPDDEPTTAPDDAEQKPDNADDADDKSGNAEAAKYRRRLRDTEAERDTLRSQVETLQRSIAEDIANRAGINGKALWANGTALADLIGEDGTVMSERVGAAVETAITDLGLAPRRRPAPNRQQGTPAGVPPATTWNDAIKAATNR